MEAFSSQLRAEYGRLVTSAHIVAQSRAWKGFSAMHDLGECGRFGEFGNGSSARSIEDRCYGRWTPFVVSALPFPCLQDFEARPSHTQTDLSMNVNAAVSCRSSARCFIDMLGDGAKWNLTGVAVVDVLAHVLPNIQLNGLGLRPYFLPTLVVCAALVAAVASK